MLIFTSITKLEFKDMESLEGLVAQLPLSNLQKRGLLKGKTIIDDKDESQAVGSGKLTHEFKITGEE